MTGPIRSKLSVASGSMSIGTAPRSDDVPAYPEPGRAPGRAGGTLDEYGTDHRHAGRGGAAAASPKRPPATTQVIIALLVGSAFVMILNETIMSVALPALITDLEVSAGTVQWLTSGFLLTMAVVIPITGFLLQRFPARAIFLASMTLFSTGTLLAALAPGFGVLLGGPRRAGVRHGRDGPAADDDDHEAGPGRAPRADHGHDLDRDRGGARGRADAVRRRSCPRWAGAGCSGSCCPIALVALAAGADVAAGRRRPAPGRSRSTCSRCRCPRSRSPDWSTACR